MVETKYPFVSMFKILLVLMLFLPSSPHPPAKTITIALKGPPERLFDLNHLNDPISAKHQLFSEYMKPIVMAVKKVMLKLP